MSAKTLIKARRTVERMRLEAAGAGQSELAIWDAEQKVVDAEAAERAGAVRTARTAGRAMDAVLLVVALLTMSFSLQNIHDFAAGHHVQDPIAWFVAPAIDLALIAALLGDAVLSRWQLDAGPWATRLRWYTGVATVVLNSWEAWAELDAAAILLHTAMPVLLFVLAEAASPYRRGFAETVKLAAFRVDTSPPAPAPAGVDTTALAPVDTAPAPEVYDQETDPGVSTRTPQVAETGPTWESESRKAVDWVFNGTGPMPRRTVDATDRPLPQEEDAEELSTPDGKLDAASARQAIEKAWDGGLTVREAAVKATRSASYVGKVYKELAARGPQPIKGQTRIGDAA